MWSIGNGYRPWAIGLILTVLNPVVAPASAQYRQLGISYGWSQFDRRDGFGQKIGRGDRYGLVFRQDVNDRFFLGLDLGIFSKQAVIHIEGSEQETLADRKLNSIEMTFFYRLLRGRRTDFFSPYLGAGGGFHSIMIEVQGVSFPSRNESQFGLHAVAGLWLKVPRLPIRLFAEGQGGRIFTRTQDRNFSLFTSFYGGASLLLMK